MISIEIDEEVFRELKTRAEPFVDTPNSVLRRELGLDDDEASERRKNELRVAPTPEVPRDSTMKRGRRKSRRGRRRAPAGSLLPETEYVDPILRAIAAKGGRAPTREVIEDVGRIVGKRLTALDKERMESGAVRWHNRVQFTRLRMVDQGLLKRGSPRGVWEITEEGMRRVPTESAA
jgi:hypothetical protein